MPLAETSDLSQFMSLAPKASTSPGETHSALMLSQAVFGGDFTFGASVLTDQQLRVNSAPNPWETAWVVWDYTDNDHFYYFALKTNGWELGKRDPAYPGGQRFLATGSDLSFLLKTWYQVSVTQAGGTMTVSVDGAQIVSFDDTERPYASGQIGLYTEDARVYVDNVTGVLDDSFDSYAQAPLQDGSLIGQNWEIAFLGFGAGGVSQLSAPAVAPAAVLALPLSAPAEDSFLGTRKADVLVGTPGADLLNGGAGGDTLSGGAGDDTYIVDNAKDLVREAAGGGVDSVRASVSGYVLPANVENLQLTGGKGQTGFGNGLDNILTSNGVSASLDGGGGDDILVSTGGRDTLTGGAGHDVFDIAALPAGPVQITDFTPGQDVLDLRTLLAGYSGPDPVLDGWVRIAPDGAGGTLVYVDADGPQTAHGFVAVADLIKVAGPLTMQVDWVFR